MGLFDCIRAAAEEVARRARSVRIDERRLAAFAPTLAGAAPPPGCEDPAGTPLGDAETTAAYVLTMASVNFGSGYFPHLRKRPGCSGYFTISLALRERFEAEGPFSPEELAALTGAECARLFGQGPNSRDAREQMPDARCPMPDARSGEGAWPARDGSSAAGLQSAIGNPQSAIEELMGLFARALNDLGRFLLRGEYGDIQLFAKSRGGKEAGSVARKGLPVSEQGEAQSRMSPFGAMVAAAGHSAERLVGLLAEMPLFRDVADYGGLAVPFYKRAQLAAADLSRALAGHPLGGFDDLADLTLFADNLVPHVLRVEGVLRYSEELLSRITRGEVIPAGSRAEIEIRACALHAVERLVAALRAQGHAATAGELDWLLWSRGQLPEYKAMPRHRTQTVFY